MPLRIGMMFAACGLVTPGAAAVAQESIDLLAALNALRTASPPRVDRFRSLIVGSHRLLHTTEVCRARARATLVRRCARYRRSSSERAAEKRQHPAPVHDAEPQQER